MTRTYQKRKRAEGEAETRRRIVEASVALHTSVGPARTTISAIAAKAGVQRHTVYAHFPEEDTLFAACTSHWASLHPFPQAQPWEREADPQQRLALRALPLLVRPRHYTPVYSEFDMRAATCQYRYTLLFSERSESHVHA